MTLFSALLLAHVSPALAFRWAGSAAAPCYEAYPTAVTPTDGSNNVSPSTIPAITVDVSCGSGSITAKLTPDSGAPTTVTLDVSTAGIVWLTDLPLAADTNYTLAVTGSDAYTGGVTSVFSTGSDPLETLSGTPSVTVDGATLTLDGYATVVVNAAPVADPNGAYPAFDLLRDREVVGGSISGTTVLVDDFSGEDGQEVCYSMRQYYADGSWYETSGEDCVDLVMDQAGCFGREKRTSGGSVAAMLLGFGLLRRKRLGGRAS